MKTAQVMKTLQVPYITLQQWQVWRAMEGDAGALEPRVNSGGRGGLVAPDPGAPGQRQQQIGKERLTKRLEELAEVAPQGKPPSDP